MCRNIFFLLLLVFFGNLNRADAQGSKPMRLELSVSVGQVPYTVIPIGSKGFVLMYKTIDEKAGNKQKWIYSQYDINFRKGWTQEFIPETESIFKKDLLKDGVIHFLLMTSEKKSSHPKYSLVSIDLNKGTLTSLTGMLPDKSTFSALEIINQYFLLAFTSGDKKAQVVIVDRNSGKSNTLVPETDGKSIAKEILSDTLKKSFTFVYEVFASKETASYCLLKLDFNLNTLSKVILDLSSDKKSLNNLKLFVRDSVNTLLIGTYSGDSDKDYDRSRENAEENTGVFTGLLQNGELINKNFYNFLDFKNFYKKFRASDVIVTKPSDKKESSSDYHLNLHDLFVVDNTCVLLLEAYYPEYHTVTNWTYDYYGHMVPVTTSVFDGYRYNTAFIAGIDSLASMQWNNSVEISNILTLDLSRRVVVLRDGSNLVLAYTVDGKIVSKIISGSESLTGIDYANVEFLYSGDKLVDDQDSKIVYWYDNYQLCYGVQEIRNSSRAESRRTVFYVNKIAFR
jgi:hypothetical protein